MIAKLTGVLDSVTEDSAIVDVSGVGYLVFCSGRTLRNLPPAGGPVSLAIETHVREDHIHLYGFRDADEKDWFGLLLSVQGVGAKLALGILTALEPDDIATAVVSQDRATLSKAPGVGPKLAARLVTELKDKAGARSVVTPVDFGSGNQRASGAENQRISGVDDAVSALVNLGYRQTEAFGAVSQAARRLGGEAEVESLIKAGLKELSA